MSLYLPTAEKIGSLLFCIKEILNHSDYAYLVVCLANGHTTVIYYRYPQIYGPFLDDLAAHAPIHNIHFTTDNLLSFSEKIKPCPCQRATNEPSHIWLE